MWSHYWQRWRNPHCKLSLSFAKATSVFLTLSSVMTFHSGVLPPFPMSSAPTPYKTFWFWRRRVAVLQAVAELRKAGLEMNFSFLNYAQSSQCRNWQDSSVSYAAGALIVHWGQLPWEPPQPPPPPPPPALNIYRHNAAHTPLLYPQVPPLFAGKTQILKANKNHFLHQFSPKASGWSSVLREDGTVFLRLDALNETPQRFPSSDHSDSIEVRSWRRNVFLFPCVFEINSRSE